MIIDTTAWHWPQYTVIVFQLLGLWANACMHGKPRTGKYSFPFSIIIAIIWILVLTAGGFFNGR